jgi:hypothetical protein
MWRRERRGCEGENNMRVIVQDETGERYSYDTNKDSLCLCPGRDEKPEVIEALREATAFLSEPRPLLSD